MSQFDDVRTAIEMLLEQIDMAIEHINAEGARAFKRGDYEEVNDLEERAVALRRFRQQVEGLIDEWQELLGGAVEDLGPITSASAYRMPLLRVLEEAGGSLKTAEALDRVGELMADRLTERDKECLGSGPVRWRNACQWARQQLVDAGLMRDDSAYGVWEISEKGRRALEEGEG